jgi:diguanylate cyclase (GGDEF)-like protein/PAS domain S-box-containing protein
MRLANYILSNLEDILQEWEDFAASLVFGGHRIDKIALRDHVKKILETIAFDIAKPETAHDQIEKSKGHEDAPVSEESAATTHGKERLALGFSLDAALAEYRALRASVIRLWQQSIQKQPLSDYVIDDLIRFNEAIDQCINESVTSYSFEKEQQMRVFDTILSFLPNISFIFTLDGRFSYVNKALCSLLSVSSFDLIGKNVFDINLPNALEVQQQIALAIHSKKQCSGDMSFPRAGKKLAFYEYILVPALDQNGQVEAIAGTARDITERKILEDQNWKQANFDDLTGLPNRRLFLNRLEQEMKSAVRAETRTALIFVDLDHFKEANDQFGHNTGDQLLSLAAARLSSCVRQTDTVARLGGDEFTIILQSLADTKYVESIAEKIRLELSMPFKIHENIVSISASIGVAISPQDGVTPEILMKNADQAMYVAKNAGRNRFSLC